MTTVSPISNASLALQHRRPVLSRDDHFDAVPGLRRETWYRALDCTGSQRTNK
jgi:hypothetical protein